MGRKGPRAKTKTVLKPVNKKEQLGGMPKMKKDKNLNKNPPTVKIKIFPIFFLFQPGGLSVEEAGETSANLSWNPEACSR